MRERIKKVKISTLIFIMGGVALLSEILLGIVSINGLTSLNSSYRLIESYNNWNYEILT